MMKIGLTWKIAVCGLLCVFPFGFIGHACQCTHWNGGDCKSCPVGCYLTEGGGWCNECQPNCVSCSQARYCDVCKPGLYGPRCDYDCNTCRNRSCTDNRCTDGCADGYFYYTIDMSCRRCQSYCVKCNDYYDCTSCLIEGLTGSFCQNCKDDYHLSNGQCRPCNTNCLYAKCYHISGNCIDGCKNGWSGRICNDACAPTCDSCERFNIANCNSCLPGYYGSSCESECSPMCIAKDGVRQCSKTKGECNDGCVIGWTGFTCTEQCGATCISCNRQNGISCTSCKPGYYGPRCNIECSKYCGKMSDAIRQCQQDNGTCLDNCVTGYKGDQCDVPCNANCRSSCDRHSGVCNGETSDNQVNGIVIGGTVGGFAVVIVLIIVAVLLFNFIKRRRKNKADPQTIVTYENQSTDNGPCTTDITGSDSTT